MVIMLAAIPVNSGGFANTAGSFYATSASSEVARRLPSILNLKFSLQIKRNLLRDGFTVDFARKFKL